MNARLVKAGIWLVALLCCDLLFAGTDGGLTPPAATGVTVIGATGVAAMKAKGDAHLVDTRSLHDFLAGHLPDALHVDYRERSARVIAFNSAEDDVAGFLARLGKFVKPEQAVIFYCNGPACWKSYKAAIAARDAKYRRVYWFRGGVSEWQQAQLPVVPE